MDEIFVYCADFEAEFSRFLPSSPLSELNRTKSLSVSDRFIDLLSLSLSLYQETDGKFSPFVDIASLGYSGDYDSGVFEPSRRVHTGGHEVYIDKHQVTL
jgi:thiamine biosynthesis lipoprotein ApbE